MNVILLVHDRSVGAGGIVTHHAEIGSFDLDLAQIDRANRVVLDGNFVLPAVAIIGDGQRVSRRSGGRRS